MPENGRTKAQEFPRALILRDHFLNMNGQGHEWLTATFKPASSSDGIAKRLEMSFMDSSCFKRMGTYEFKGTFKRSIVLSSFFHLHSNGYMDSPLYLEADLFLKQIIRTSLES